MDNIKGKVIQGIRRGRKLGFPTANIEVGSNLDLEQGIYAGHIIINNTKHKSAIYFPGEKIIEAFIFDFSEDIYGKEVEIEIIKKIRDKINFKNDAEAKEQISKDILEIKKYLQK